MDYSPSAPISHRPSLTGPGFLIATGVIFLVGEFVPEWGISKTWPVLLIVIGVLRLLDSTMPPRPPVGPKV
jgi:membrane-bound ClpP family serine protease